MNLDSKMNIMVHNEGYVYPLIGHPRTRGKEAMRMPVKFKSELGVTCVVILLCVLLLGFVWLMNGNPVLALNSDPDGAELPEPTAEATAAEPTPADAALAITEADELAEAGDYEAAFARIEKGLEELPEDEKLQQKAEEQKKDFVDYVTREALGKVDSGDFPDAADFVEESSGIYSCEALAILYDEIVESEDWSAPQPAQYSAKEITFTEYPGEIKGKTKKKTYSVKAEQSGAAIWEFTRMESELKAQFSVKGPDGKEIVKKTAVTDGSKLLCEFVKGEKYTAEVTATGGEGNYRRLGL